MVGELLHQLPLLSGSLWLLCGLLPLLRIRRRPLPTEMVFMAFGVLIGASAFTDWVLLNSTDTSDAIALSNLRLNLTGSAALCFLLFAKWVTRGRRRWDAAFALPTALAAVVLWTLSPRGAVMEPWGPRVIRDPLAYGLEIFQGIAYVGLGFLFIIRALRGIWGKDRALALRASGFLASTAVSLAVASTSVANNLTGAHDFPMLSSLLFIPATIMLLFMLTLQPGRTHEALAHLLRMGRRHIDGACLMDQGGRIVALASPEGPAGAGSSTFPQIVATLDNIMAQGFGAPTRSLRTVVVGNTTVLLTRGEKYVLLLALRGPYHDYLRSELDQALRRMEGEAATLGPTRFSGAPALDALNRFIHAFINPG